MIEKWTGYQPSKHPSAHPLKEIVPIKFEIGHAEVNGVVASLEMPRNQFVQKEPALEVCVWCTPHRHLLPSLPEGYVDYKDGICKTHLDEKLSKRII